jgi:DNA helicase-2/ATP-dependent DNA helicase PcrA
MKYLACTFAPGNKRQFRHPSTLFSAVTQLSPVLTRPSKSLEVGRLEPRPRQEISALVMGFSELKYLIECPYQFKLWILYGFNPPLHEALG